MKRIISIFVIIFFALHFNISDAIVVIGSSVKLPKDSQKGNVAEAQIKCEPEMICVLLDANWLKSEWNLTNYNGLMIGNNCQAETSFIDGQIQICSNNEKLLKCESHFNINDTYVTYANNLTIASTNSTTRIVHASLNWTCTYPTELVVTTNFLPEISRVQNIFLGDQSGEGKFKAVMFLYKDSLFNEAYDKTPQLEANDKLRVKIQLIDGPSDAKMQAFRCWGTPGNDFETSKQQFFLIDDYCPSTEAVLADIIIGDNGNSHHVFIQSNVFRFIEQPEVFLHCHVRLCFSGDDCQKTCENRTTNTNSERSRRSVILKDDVLLSLGPIQMSDEIPFVHDFLIQTPDTFTQWPTTTLQDDPTVFGLEWTTLSVIVAVLAFSTLCFVIIAFVLIRRKIWRQRQFDVTEGGDGKNSGRVKRNLSRQVTINSRFGIPMDTPNTIRQ